jgi:hypothetical protein
LEFDITPNYRPDRSAVVRPMPVEAPVSMIERIGD